MPRQDGSGPFGQGPMTGRKQGRCIGRNSSTAIEDKKELEFGRGFRYMRRFFSTNNQSSSKRFELKNRINELEQRLTFTEEKLNMFTKLQSDQTK